MLKERTGKDIKPGQKLCAACRKRKLVIEKLDICYADTDTSEFDPLESQRKKLDTSLVELDVSPLKPQRVSRRDLQSCAKRKTREAQKTICQQLSSLTGVNVEEGSSISQQKCID